MNPDEPVLLCEDRDGVRTLTLNRPRRKNAINRELWIALAQALTDAGKDDGIRAVVLTGARGRSAPAPISRRPMTVIPSTSCNG